ncbi:hypothetical protein [Ralstonia pseudosolanacearum]
MKNILVGLALATSQVAWATDTPTFYAYHPMSTMYLGAGFSPPDLTSAKIPCVAGDVTSVDGDGAGSGEITTTVVSSASQARDAVHVDAKVDASYLVYKGSASFNFDQTMTFDENSVSVVMYAANTFSRRIIKSPVLTPAAKATLNTGDIKQFVQQCGSQLVSMEQRGVMISVILTIRNMSESSRQVINSSVSASGGYGPLSGSASAAFKNELSKASQESRLQANVVYVGGSGTAAMEQMVKATLSGTPTMDGISAGIANYVKTMTAANAAPLGYFVTDMPGLSVIANAPWSDLKQSKLESIVAAYRKFKNASDQIDAIASGADARSGLLSKSKMDSLVGWKPKLNVYLADLAAAHVRCLNDVGQSADQCVMPADSGFQLSSMPYPNQPPDASIRIVVGPDEWRGKLLSKADSEAVLGSLLKDSENDLNESLRPKSMLLGRASSTIPGTRVAWKVLLIDSPYLDSLRAYIEPTGDFRKNFTDVEPKYITGEPIGRASLPAYDAHQSGGQIYSYHGADFDSATNPIYLEQDPFTISGPELPVSFVYEEMRSFAAGASGTTKAKVGTADFVVEVRDQLGNTVKFRPYSMSWTYDPKAYTGLITFNHMGVEKTDTLSFKVITKANCLKDNPGLDFLCKGLP